MSTLLNWIGMQSRGRLSVPALTRLKNNHVKSRERACKTETATTRVLVAIVKTVPKLACVSQDAEPSGRNPRHEVLGSIWRVQFTQSPLCQASIREKKRKNTGQNSSSAKSLRCEIWGQISRRDWLKDKSDAPAATHGSLSKKFTCSKQKTKIHSIRLPTYQWVDYDCRIHHKTRGKRVCGRFLSKYTYGQQERS